MVKTKKISITLKSILYREDNLTKYLWSNMSDFIFNDVFLTAAQAESIG